MLYELYIIIFYSTHAIFDKEIFSKCTDSYTKEHKLYNKLLDKISLEIELLIPSLLEKDEPTLVFIPHILISSIQSNSPTCSPLPFFFYKSLFFSFTLGSKKPIIKIEENDDVDSNIKIWSLSP